MGLASCDHFPGADDVASRLPPYRKAVDRPKSLIDTALDDCPDKTEDKEAACVTQALSSRQVSVAALAAMVPGCRLGRVCLYRHTSEDRLGYVPAIAADFVTPWTVRFDLVKPVARAADAPITVALD